MGNRSASWFARFFLCLSCPALLFCEEDWLWEGDTSLVLPIDEPERLVSITGELVLREENRDPENPELGTVDCWVIKMNPASFEIACSTPVHAAFQSPESIQSCSNCSELELTGGYDKDWLHEHLGQTVTLSGYLWHAHTAHHHTPVMMDTNPWFK